MFFQYLRAILAAFFLHEKLGIVGKIGCALCLIGSVVIVLHAPEEKEINSVDEILNYALQPGKQFLLSKSPSLYLFNFNCVGSPLVLESSCVCGGGGVREG